MNESFDPYLEWLRIPPEEQPPNHYCLLGIKIYENDPKLITETALEVTTVLRQYRLSDKSEQSNKLMGEVVHAKMCLLDPERKRVYDNELKQKLHSITVDTSVDNQEKTDSATNLNGSIFAVSVKKIHAIQRHHLFRWSRVRLMRLRRKKYFLPHFRNAIKKTDFTSPNFLSGTLFGILLTVIAFYLAGGFVVTTIAVIILLFGLLSFYFEI